MQRTILTVILSCINCIYAENGIWTGSDFVDKALYQKEMEVTAVLKQRQLVLELANALESIKNMVADLKDQLGTQSAIIAMQQTDINELKEQVKQLSGRLDVQNVFIDKLKKENKAQLQTIQVAETSNELFKNSYMNKDAELSNELSKNSYMNEDAETSSELSSNSDMNEDKNETGKQNVHKSEVSEEIGEGHISALERNYRNNGNEKHNRRYVLNREGPVAFHAVNNGSEIPHEAIMQPVRFDTVLLNLGGAYHSSTSLFIAEQFGVYIFSASIMSFVDPHQEFSASIVKNGVILARIYGHGDNYRHDQGSATVIVQLNAGDEVWVRMEYISDTSLYGEKYTTFTGALLWNV